MRLLQGEEAHQVAEEVELGACASFCWRVRRLWAHGFLARHSLPMVDSEFVYSIAGPGVTFLETAGALYNGPRNGPKVSADGAGVAHALGLNAIHLDVLRSGQLVLWQTEVEIRSENELAISSYAKHYDAILTLQIDGRSVRVALEWERTAKMQSEYLRIRELFEREKRIDRFLYLAANSHIHSLEEVLLGNDPQCVHRVCKRPVTP